MLGTTLIQLLPLPPAKTKRSIPDGFPFACFDRGECPNSVDCLYGGCAKGYSVTGFVSPLPVPRAFLQNTSDMGRTPAYGIAFNSAKKGQPVSVLRYGFPQSDGLRCDHPTCDRHATHRLLLQPQVPEAAIAAGYGHAEREVFACDEHAQQLQIGSHLVRDERLKKAGERNVPLAEIKK